MSLTTERRIGPYEISGLIGVGGMGVVYRARDLKLNREVALKVLPTALAQNKMRMARFQREAQILASLNHPGIAAIYGLEESADATPQIQTALVMELVEGPTLADRIARGPIPVDEALPIARQMAEILEYAHEKGVIHRDIKPANIKVSTDGQVKVLDFGLAKALETEGTGSSGIALTQLPTDTAMATQAGVILGTAAYMSPEQARGKPVDKRSDIWSFGCVLFEMLSGTQAIGTAESVTDTLAAVLRGEPEWNLLPPAVGAPVRRLLLRCLEKDARKRLRDIGDARIEIEDEMASLCEPGVDTQAPAPASAPWPRRHLPWLLTGILALACAVALWGLRKKDAVLPGPHLHASIGFPEGWAMIGDSTLAFSRDGRRLAFVLKRDSVAQLHVRPIGQLQATPVPGTDNAYYPMFSPDGEWVAFFSGGKLKKVALAGGTPVSVCDAPHGRGGYWGPDGMIIFSPSYDTPLYRVPAAGGTAEKLTSLDQEQGEGSHRWPELLPDGETILYTVAANGTPSFEDARIVAQSIKTGARRTLVEGGSYPRFLASGHVLYARNRELIALPLDPSSLQPRGKPTPVLDGMRMSIGTGAAGFALSDTGLLAYAPAGAEESNRTLVWVDRGGRPTDIPAPQRPYYRARLSPDGARVALQINTPGDRGIWTFDLRSGQLRRITFAGAHQYPIWSPDGTSLICLLQQVDQGSIVSTPTEGGGSIHPLITSRWIKIPTSISAATGTLAYAEIDPVTRWDIWTVPLQGANKPRPIFRGPSNEADPHFSPDGRWLSFNSNESGQDEIYVVSYPALDRKWQVSVDGGVEAHWSSSGKELFYRSGDRMMALEVSAGATLNPSKPHLLFEGKYEYGYDVSPDGTRFLMIRRSEPEMPVTLLDLIVGWHDEMAGLRP